MLKKSQLEISLSRRNYTGTDLPFIGQIGISSGLMTVVVFALYIVLRLKSFTQILKFFGYFVSSFFIGLPIFGTPHLRVR